MKVVTTCSKRGFEEYGHRWVESRHNWPEGTEFAFYGEGFAINDCPCYDISTLHYFEDWKKRYANYVPPSWRFNVVKYSYKVFAAFEALRDYDGVGVWLDADCVTFDKIPTGLVEEQVADAYIALYQRTGHYSETGMWIMDCTHPQHKDFWAWVMMMYHSGHFTRLHEWHDCTVLDAAIRRFTAKGLIKVKNLSGDFAKEMHPSAKAEPFCRYVDHCKGGRKAKGYSAENQHRAPAQ